MSQFDQLHGILLAGGRSSRMGRPKHLLPIGEKMMLQHTLELMGLYTNAITVITNQPELLPVLNGVEVKTDPPEFFYAGPVAGIIAGMEGYNGWHFVIACDLPNIQVDIMERLLSERDTEAIDAIIPTVAGKSQPLVGFYHSRCQPIFKQCLDKNQRKVLACLKEVRTRYVAFDDRENVEELFFNMNTPEDYQKIIGRKR